MTKKRIVWLCIWASFHSLVFGQSFEIGDTIPNFQYEGQFSKPYFLKELKGSFVLIHFWASWNEESREMQLSFIDSYAKFRDKKFNKGRKFYIISVSLDEMPEIWNLALKKDNLPWKNHVCEFKGWKSSIVNNLRIETIPANYLVDPNGKIVEKNLNKEQLDQFLKTQ